MKAALREIEKDVAADRLPGQEYARLYDRLQIMTGGKQRYGTQVVVRPNGDQVVPRLEDPDRVDERRKTVGLGPLAAYLELFGDVTIER